MERYFVEYIAADISHDSGLVTEVREMLHELDRTIVCNYFSYVESVRDKVERKNVAYRELRDVAVVPRDGYEGVKYIDVLGAKCSLRLTPVRRTRTS